MSVRDQIRNRRPKIKPTQAFGGAYVRQLTGEETIRVAKKAAEKPDAPPLEEMALLLCFALCEESGERVFTDEEAPMILATYASEDIKAAAGVAFELNGLTKKDVEAAQGN